MRLLATIVMGAVMAWRRRRRHGRKAVEAKDEAAVRDVVKRYVDAREARDAKALAALFTEDADQLTSSGEWRKGREQVVQGGLRRRRVVRDADDQRAIRAVSRGRRGDCRWAV